MTIDVVNTENERVGTLEISDEIFGGPIKGDLVWESVVHEQAAARRGTHATKNRALVSGSGRKPWRQKGTGRARVGEIRNPLWRKGGTVFGPQPRSYDYALPRKVERGALRTALAQRIRGGEVTVVEELAVADAKTKTAVELLGRLGVKGSTLLIDVAPDEKLTLAVRNLPQVRLVSSRRVTARDVIGPRRVIATRAAIERLQRVLGQQNRSGSGVEDPEDRGTSS